MQLFSFSIPTLWHTPVQENAPQIKIGDVFELDGIRRYVALPGLTPGENPAQSYLSEIWSLLPGECTGLTYYTSLLPA